QFAQTFDFQGVARTYQLYVPSAYHGTTDVPVVFDFHGYGSNAVQQMVYGNFKPLADRHDFLIVAPDGQGASRHFNLTNERGLQNDIAMVLALLDHIEATFCVDKDRVYSTGMSDGGAMTSVLACVASNRFAAFGPDREVRLDHAAGECERHDLGLLRGASVGGLTRRAHPVGDPTRVQAHPVPVVDRRRGGAAHAARAVPPHEPGDPCRAEVGQ